MACVTPAWFSRGQTYRSSFWRTISYFSFRALWFANDTARPPSSVYTVISGNPRSHAEYLVDSVNPVSKQVPRNCRNSKWSSLTWHLAHSASAFVTNQLIWISLNQGANSTWWGRTRKVWGRTRHKVGANSIGGERGAIRHFLRKKPELDLVDSNSVRNHTSNYQTRTNARMSCMSKFTNLYERILKMQALIGLKDCHKPMGISVAFIHQHLKDNANPRVCLIALLWMIVCIILKLDQDLLLTDQTSFVYPLRWGFQVFITTEWRIDAELSWNVA